MDAPFLVVPVSLESTVPVSWHSPPVALSSEVPPVQVPVLESEAVPMVLLGPPKKVKKNVPTHWGGWKGASNQIL